MGVGTGGAGWAIPHSVFEADRPDKCYDPQLFTGAHMAPFMQSLLPWTILAFPKRHAGAT